LRSPKFELNPALDAAALAARFAAERRVRIADFLCPESAAALRAHLCERTDWVQVVNSGAKVFDLDRAIRAAMGPERERALDDSVYAGARTGFQHRYQAIRVPDAADARAAAADLLNRFALWMSQGGARDFLRQVSGNAGLAFLDAQATAYSAGDFLTAHDDDVPGKNRLAAYVLGLTPVWRAEWGGLLLFHDAHGDIERGYTPRFNTLNLFAVPQLHSVSLVSRAAPHPRYAVTGWLRAA
jgi:Rps23 Pro-64 3,4-dihydroxylase Tpa1-like proline 4-hydroxylase